MSLNPEQTRLGEADRPLIQDFIDAYRHLRGDALANPGHAETPADNDESLVARYVDGPHEISFEVPSANVIAGRGLRSVYAWWQRRKLHRLPARAFVDVAVAEEPPISLYFRCDPGGNRMHNPSITGGHNELPAGHGPLWVPASRETLIGRAQTVIDAAHNPDATVTFEQPGQNSPHFSFIGVERTRFTKVLRPLAEMFQPYKTGKHRLAETIATNDLALEDTHDISLRVGEYGIRLEVSAREGQESDLPTLVIVAPPLRKPGDWDKLRYGIQNADGSYIRLPRAQREALITHLAERLNPENFSKTFTKDELLRPDETLMTALANLAPEEERYNEHIFHDSETGVTYRIHAILSAGLYHVALKGPENHATVLTVSRDTAVVEFGSQDETRILQLYVLLRKAGAPPAQEAE